MNLFLLENSKQVEALSEHSLDHALLLALTPWAMKALDEQHLPYKIITDFIPMADLDEIPGRTCVALVSMCEELDKAIRRTCVDVIDECYVGDYFEPTIWLNKYLMLLFSPLILYERVLDKVISSVNVSKIYYFGSQQGGREEDAINITNDSFIATIIEIIRNRYGVEFIKLKYCTAAKENRKVGCNSNNSLFKGSLVDLIPPSVRMRIMVMKRMRFFNLFAKKNRSGHRFLILNINNEMGEILKRECTFNEIWLWLQADKRDTVPHLLCLLTKGARLSVNEDIPKNIFTIEDYAQAIKNNFPNISLELKLTCMKKYDAIHSMARDLMRIYMKALKFILKNNITHIFATNGADPFNNAIMSAGKHARTTVGIYQHGGSYGHGHRWAHGVQDYYFATHFFTWGRHCGELIKKYEKPRCEFIYIGRLQQTVSKRKRSAKKKVLFIPNNSYKGFLHGGDSDCWIYDVEKKVMEIFKRFPQYEYILKPTPKHRFEDILQDIWRKNLPQASIVKDKGLIEACSEADLVIQEHMGTTLLDAFMTGSTVIGLRRSSFGAKADEYISNIATYQSRQGTRENLTKILKIRREEYETLSNEMTDHKNEIDSIYRQADLPGGITIVVDENEDVDFLVSNGKQQVSISQLSESHNTQ